jgi:acetyl/propionyl-CoA carboxylase alpha subunit
MIAKVISHGKDRVDATRILNNALSDFMVHLIRTISKYLTNSCK